MPLNQSGRLIRMTQGPLGPDEVVVTSFSGREAMSRPFDFEIEFISTRLDLRPGDIIGKALTVEIDRRDRDSAPLSPRYFHGYVNRFAAGELVVKDPGEHKYRHYRAGLVPWLWFLTKTARCYLFFPEKEDKSIFEVIEAVFDRAKSDLHVDPVSDLKGIGDLRSRKVKHCVQYRETDFNFVSRTMEQYGVFYYFKFEEGKHTLVLDMKKNYPACEEDEVMFPKVAGAQPAGDHVTRWQHDYRFVSGKWSHTDYNFETPSTSLKASVPKLPSVDLPQCEKYEVYDYPGEYAVQPEGETSARVRQEEEEVQHDAVDGASTCRTFAPGYKFTLTTHPDDDSASEHDKSYLLTSVAHSARQPSDDTTDWSGATYHNSFTCIADSVQFRPPRSTPRPVISGVQTAVIVGPSGEEIYTDKYGRVKVLFHWDREGEKKKDENCSCWVRVSQPWAGKGWGSVATPRIGQEVIVEFLEGDPDRPVITGRVYNEDNQPPFGFPAGAVISGLKSATHKGSGYNELSMDDTAGKEKINIHGQYDMTTTVEHDKTTTVNNNRSTTVVVDDTLNIDANRTVHVKGKLAETIDTGQEVTITSGYKETVTGEKKVTVTGPIKESATSTIDIHATGAGTYTSDTSLKLAVAGSVVEITPAAITISSGGSTIKLDASGVSVNGAKISLNG